LNRPTKRIKHKRRQAKTFRNWYKNYARSNASAGKIIYSKVANVTHKPTSHILGYSIRMLMKL